MPGNHSQSQNQTSMGRADFGSPSQAESLAVSGSSLGRRSDEQSKLTLRRIPSPTSPFPPRNKNLIVGDSHLKCLKAVFRFRVEINAIGVQGGETGLFKTPEK